MSAYRWTQIQVEGQTRDAQIEAIEKINAFARRICKKANLTVMFHGEEEPS